MPLNVFDMMSILFVDVHHSFLLPPPLVLSIVWELFLTAHISDGNCDSTHRPKIDNKIFRRMKENRMKWRLNDSCIESWCLPIYFHTVSARIHNDKLHKFNWMCVPIDVYRNVFFFGFVKYAEISRNEEKNYSVVRMNERFPFGFSMRARIGYRLKNCAQSLEPKSIEVYIRNQINVVLSSFFFLNKWAKLGII